ncbi:UNVERIFIED_CONTAM: hypothetical protein HDU68_010858 [Siphonaria sp. JEL0065]|nr:hypothetical protein HDU68_010858 [Siphonaria sp. JEL0065]
MADAIEQPQNEWGTLKALAETDTIKTINLTKDKTGYVIGRHSECDIQVDLPQLSKRHCVVFQEVSVSEGGNVASVFIEDLSTNGTFVNFKRIGKGKRHKLQDGDSIQLLHSDKQKAGTIAEKFWIFRLPKKQETNSFDEDFELDAHLGSGNFAQVRLGRHKATSHLHAVKILDKKIFAGNAKIMQNIEQEISILMALNHPCIIKIHQVYNLPKTINIVMEYAKGGELFDRIIDQTKFTERESRILMTQLFHALEYLHDRGIVHRDLKPENILLVSKATEDLRIKISDFGLAKLIPEQNYLKTLCGTPNYVAPEVLKGGKDGRAYGSAVDLWSCGVILYICLVGQPPFSDELAPPSMMDQIKQGLYNFPSPWWDEVSPEAIDLIKKLIIVDPQARLTAAQALQHPWMTMESDAQKANSSSTSTPTTPLRKDPALSQLPSPEKFSMNDTTVLSASVLAEKLNNSGAVNTSTAPVTAATTPKAATRSSSRRLFGDVTTPVHRKRVVAAEATPAVAKRKVDDAIQEGAEKTNGAEEREGASSTSPKKAK